MQQTPHNGRRRREKVEHRLCEREVTKRKPKQKKDIEKLKDEE